VGASRMKPLGTLTPAGSSGWRSVILTKYKESGRFRLESNLSVRVQAMSVQAIDRNHLLRVGDIARLSGKTVRAIHLYEEMGLLQPATRSSGGFRLYEPVAVDRLRWIDLLHGLGFSLHEMRDLVKSWWGSGLGPEAMARLRAVFLRKLEETRQAVRMHQKLEQELSQGLAYLETCRDCATPAAVNNCAHCAQDHGMTREPVLVAGITAAREAARRHARQGFVRVEDIV
jgi:MerR family copper efflux transcriptional regulator